MPPAPDVSSNRHPQRHQQRQQRAERETEGRCQRGLQRPGARGGGNAQFVARVGLQRIMRHQLFRYLPGQRRIQPAMHVDRRQFAELPG